MEEENKNNKKSDAASREEAVLKFWQENNIFEKSVSKNEGGNEFVFYEGPPTANAKPALHHLEARSFKDVIPRYKTMRGFHVARRAGWDTHGLPVELQIEKKLGLQSKKEIESYGVAKFNKECKDSVFEYISDWEKFTDRIGYWVDKEHAYYTFNPPYIESLWNIISKVNDKGLLYKDYKVVPWCPRCGTGLSSHELAQGYQEDKDLSVYVKFKIIGFPDAYFLAWTTTPWTLPGNVGLAVGENVEYVEIKIGKEILVLAKERLAIITDQYEIIATHKGSEMVGMGYEPLYPYLQNLDMGDEKLKNAYKVYAADFVNTEDGTGIVHTAVMYGQDDFELGTKVGLPKFHLVDEAGHFVKGTGFLEGRFVKETNDVGKPTLAVDIIEDLKKRGLFFSQETIKHQYPHCWRCKTALIYYARDSWYIKMSELRDTLIAENKKINWEPEHTQEGRFGEWIREVKDWAISRERYWGTPLPIWESEDGEKIVVDSYETLKKYTKRSGNTYFVMRHGGTEGNAKGLISYKNQATDNLTEEGIREVEKTAEDLKNKKIDLIVSSPFTRTRETSEIVREKLGLSSEQVKFKDELHEINAGEFDGKTWEEYHQYILKTGKGWFEEAIPGGESLRDAKCRTGKVMYELESEYKNKNILIVTHGGPAWALFVNAGLFDPNGKPYQPADTHVFVPEFKRFENAEVRELPFVPMPHDENYELDPHRPFIDEVVLEKDGKEFRRVKEVMDVWFDSGAMPFAQDHYPFEHKELSYPADFISEAIDQTRGWFYTLLAVGVLMGEGTPYRNVICLGHLLDAEGKKMSKSIGNIVDPWVMIEKYGVDTLRLWMYSVNQPGDSKNFDEKTVLELQRQVFGLLYNVLAFYELYRDRELEVGSLELNNVLDQWIVERLHQLTEIATKNLDAYKLFEPVRAIKDFVADLSQWYLRRSRDRIKEGDVDAKRTLYYVLKELAKLLAPFAPFAAEDIWQKLRSDTDNESVHLVSWPEVPTPEEELADFGLIEKMTEVRAVVSLALEMRQKAKIPVRQPLASLKIKDLKFGSEYFELVMEELNVKEIIEDSDIETLVMLDTNISGELKAEGDFRELVRAVQDLRKKKGLTPSDKISVTLSPDVFVFVDPFIDDFKKVVLADEVKFEKNDGEEVKIGQTSITIQIEKK